jgi:cytochrome c-type biogenesis protein CcmE
MRGSTLIPVLISTVAIGVVIGLYAQGASPYVNVTEAKKMSGDRLNLYCEIDKSTVKKSIASRVIEFDAKDKDGVKAHIKHVGDAINIDNATHITAVGKFEGDTFVSQQILVKCPSKYEGKDAKPRN